MIHPRSAIVLVAVLSVAGLAACSKEEPDAEMIALRASSQEQLEALKKHNSLLNKKLIGINERLNKLQELNTQLTAELAYFRAAPDTMKGEIINEVNRRFMTVINNQSAFFDTVAAAYKSRMTALDNRLVVGMTEVNETVKSHEEFVRFVTVQQDSLNSVFASRVDKRPWVESILGKWEDMQHERQDQ